MSASDLNAHRPWPVPTAPFAMAMNWHDLLFMHWPLERSLLRPHLPERLEIETFDGSAWLGVVPFRMTGVRPRRLPPMRMLSEFPELNVRTYVTIGGRPGVWFFSLDAANRIAVAVARQIYHLNYANARMRCERDAHDVVSYQSRRTHRGMAAATFRACYRPTGSVFRSVPGSIEHFLTERYCLYAQSNDGRLFRGEIAHVPWPLRPAAADVVENTMTEQLGFGLPDVEPLLHFADRLDVIAWKPQLI